MILITVASTPVVKQHPWVNVLLHYWHTWIWPLALLVGLSLIALVCHYTVFRILKRIAKQTPSDIDNQLVRYSEKPGKYLFLLIGVYIFLQAALPISTTLLEDIRRIATLGLIATLAWFSVALMHALQEIFLEKYNLDEKDNLKARRINTQIILLRRVTVLVVVIIAAALMLMTFPSVRHIGTTLFASAGVMGLVVGIAARPALANLIAGVQIALTEPIRIDDVVVVEGEWGRIEEIGSTYVVVRIWDLRRLVLPLSYFIEKPFQNWTRVTTDILGTVFLYADYNIPVEPLRQELHRLLQSSELWDGKVWNLQVTNASEHTLELRAMMSAGNSGDAWNLRCYVREHLVDYLQQHYPHSLPKTRAQIGDFPINQGPPNREPQ